jgi:predicted secreted protein
MGIVSTLAVYFVVWWLMLMVVLPWGVRRDEAPEVGNDTGAPVNPMMRRKLIWTSVLTGLVTAAVYVLASYNLTSLDTWFHTSEDWYLKEETPDR